MYILVLKKTQKEKSPYPIQKALREYFKKRNNNIILISPGFLSCTVNTICKFFKDFQKITQLNNNIVIFAGGMNGFDKVKHSSNTILDEHYTYLKNKYPPFAIKKDHSKFLIFIENNLSADDTETIESVTSNIIEQIKSKKSKVIAILLGSSNFSYTTYFSSPANKGEADVFILSEEIFNDDEIIKVVDQLRDNNLDGGEIILSKEIGVKQNLNLIAHKLLEE